MSWHHLADLTIVTSYFHGALECVSLTSPRFSDGGGGGGGGGWFKTS